MKLRYILVIAIICLVLSVIYVVQSYNKEPERKPYRSPAEKPYSNSLAGTGIIESLNENISVDPYWQGKVVKVFVKEGDKVNKGDPIYELDSKEMRANLDSVIAQSEATKATLEKLKHLPRLEDVPPLKAQVQQAESNYQNMQAQLEKLKKVSDKRAVSQDSIDKATFQLNSAKADLDRAEAELAKLKAGAWKYDIQQTAAEYKALLAQAEITKVNIDHSIVRAPISGEILKSNIRIGEVVSKDPTTPPILIGTTDTLQLRVDIDEINASDIKPHMKAMASLRGDTSKKFPLEFVRIQPYMVPKENLSGASIERVDVRVLQLIYKFEPPPFPVYVGQQVDVFIDNKNK